MIKITYGTSLAYTSVPRATHRKNEKWIDLCFFPFEIYITNSMCHIHISMVFLPLLFCLLAIVLSMSVLLLIRGRCCHATVIRLYCCDPVWRTRQTNDKYRWCRWSKKRKTILHKSQAKENRMMNAIWKMICDKKIRPLLLIIRSH